MNKNLLFMLLLLASWVGADLSAQESIKIALIIDGPSSALEHFAEQLQDEVSDLLERDYGIEFVPLDKSTANWTLNGAQALLTEALEDSSIDLVIALGALATDATKKVGELSKPVFAPFVIEAELQGFPLGSHHPKIFNLNYLTFPTDISSDLQRYRELIPLKHITFVLPGAIYRSIPAASEMLRRFASEEGLTSSVVGLEGSIETLIQAIPESTDAIYLLPQLELEIEEQLRLISRFRDRSIPTFVLMGRPLVEGGALASTTPEMDHRRLVRRVALNIQRVLSGELPHELAVMIPAENHLLINMEIAHHLGLSIPWEILLDAELLHVRATAKEPAWTLLKCVETALCANRDLAAIQRNVEAGREDVRRAQARLCPQLEISSLSRIIDEDRARASFGLEPERAAYGAASASQVLYSNRLMGDLCIQKQLQSARCEKLESVQLDVILDVSTAHLNLLRAHTIERIQRDNLMLTRSHLKLAQQRQQVGTARASEVYRWESQIASNRTQVVNAHYAIRSLEVFLNRVMNRCQEAPIPVDEVLLDEPFWILKAEWFNRHASSDKEVRTLSDFAVCESLKLSPEIHQQQHQLRAQAQTLGVATRALWTPDFILSAEVRDRMTEGGAGTRLPALANSTDWAVGINVRFPLYEGGAKTAQRRQAYHQLLSQKAQLEAVSQHVEHNVRTSIHRASASFATIGLSRAAAKAATKNLKLVSEAYSKGTTTIVDLLDAQNQALVAELVAANAVYDFIIDLLKVQRAIGRFDFMLNEEERKAILEHLNSFISWRQQCANS